MKFIDELDVELVNQTLNFETSDCKVNGGCDIFTTKPVASDKKLYKTIDRHLDSLLVENEGFNSAVQQQIALENPGSVSSSPRDQKSDAHHLYSTRGDSGSPSSFWEQKRRISVSDSSNGSGANGSSLKTHKLNDQNLKDLVNSESGYMSSSSTESHSRPSVGVRRTSSSGSLAFGSGIQRRRSSAHKESVNIGPFGPINETASRRAFAYLIAILNASYPDYDFASLEPTDFVKSSMKSLISKFENSLISFGKQPQEWIWETINSHMDVSDCAIYQYKPSKSFLDDEPGHLWSLMWFLFNKKRKRVAYLYLNVFRLKSGPLADNLSPLGLADEDEDDHEKESSRRKPKRKSTIDHESNTFEGEYDLTCASNDENAIEDDDESTEN
ncbi:LANO_0C03884g1_1 [Lachancea nothofagi CBS 11611]|uniref:Repressor of RNA polymerase III transcription MAF1 n=1 Tax=Lachancea nothofagi CBS 11611 TaxID=1266666 RepID=A0A1G4J646_9SACH|nr:LANO_0C03884g1_1 [Lachancea nothofagi CBS 11611]